MGPKWPFILTILGLLFGLGYTIMSFERNTIITNWATRRCDLTVMVAATFLKPENDTRSSTEFAMDNISFCIKTQVESFMNLFMQPINALFSKNMNVTGIAMDALNTIRIIATKLYEGFMTYLSQYFKKFHTAIFEISRIIQYLRMAVNRAIAVAISMLYAGLSIFRTMINTIQFMIKVILIICTILLILILILFFALFPVIPMILATLAAVIAAVVGLVSIMPSSLIGDASDKASGFCFSENTPILVRDANGTVVPKFTQDIRIGDELAENCGKVTAVIIMDGSNSKLYSLNGVYLSGTHLVKGVDGIWTSVANDSRAVLTKNESPLLYCYNTTSNNIPIYTTNGILLCRDWEEIGNDDEKGQYIWNYLISQMLNKNSEYALWKDNVRSYVNVAVVGEDTLVKTNNGFVKISTICIHDIILDQNGNQQVVRGVVSAEIENVSCKNNTWKTELYELHNNIWVKGDTTLQRGNNSVLGITLITDSGDFIIWNDDFKKEIIVRDFTEIGYDCIHETYSFVEARLRITEPVQ